MSNQAEIDKFWLEQAMHYASRSKDPSTKVGCVIVRPNGTLASAGRNGFPKGFSDTPARLETKEVKYGLTIHAEMNALHFAHEDLTGATAYATFAPCGACAIHMIQRGISRVVYPFEEDNVRWMESQKRALAYFAEGGVEAIAFDMASGESFLKTKDIPTIESIFGLVRCCENRDEIAL